MKFRECFTYDWEDDPRSPSSLKDVFWLWLFDIQYQTIVKYRIFRWLSKSENRYLRKLGLLYQIQLARVPGVEINSSFDLGKGIRFSHPRDVVIGAGARVGSNVTIYNGVTLGAKQLVESGEDPFAESRYPKIEDGVVIFPGARIIGGITIGADSIVGANSVVLRSFPPNSVIAGVPARIIDSVG